MKTLMIIAQEGYRDEEYDKPKQILEQADFEVVTASKQRGVCTGKLGGNTEASISMKDVNVTEYDIVIFIGGPGAEVYQHDTEAHRVAQETIEQHKFLAAICIAPTILAFAGVLEGKKATAWNGDGQSEKILQQQGATFTAEDVTVDGKLITANGPGAAAAFGKKIVEILNEN